MITLVSAAKEKILVVDDEPAITELVSMALRYEGFDPICAATAAEARSLLASQQPALTILDIGLPDVDGFSMISQLRSEGIQVPVIFLTARDATDEKIRGLTLGGDDYVTKPFSIDELVARIRVVLRRSKSPEHDTTHLQFSDLVLDEETHEVWRGDRPIDLTKTEFRLLRYLMVNARHVLSRSQILDHVWSYDFEGDGRILETYISYLRRKVDASDPHLINTVRGLGYVLRLPREG